MSLTFPDLARLRFREFTPGDLVAIHAYASDPVVSLHQPWGPNNLDESAAFLRNALEQQTATDRKQFDLAVEKIKEGALIGAVHISFAILREAEIGYSFHARHWGQGFATEAAKGLLRMAFSRDGVLRVKAAVGTENFGSIRVLEKIGMRREAFFKDDVKLRDRMRSSYLYSYDRDSGQTLR